MKSGHALQQSAPDGQLAFVGAPIMHAAIGHVWCRLSVHLLLPHVCPTPQECEWLLPATASQQKLRSIATSSAPRGAAARRVHAPMLGGVVDKDMPTQAGWDGWGDGLRII